MVMTPLRRRMLEDIQLRVLAPKTQQAYIRAVRQLAEYYDKSPDLISEEELHLYFLYLTTEKHLARSTTTVTLSALTIGSLLAGQCEMSAFVVSLQPSSI